MANFIPTDILGARFGKLVVRKYLRRNKYTYRGGSRFKYWYLCTCDCGTSRPFLRSNLVTGHTTSCGCYKRLLGESHHSWRGHGKISGQAWATIKRTRAERKLSFGITIEDTWNQFQLQSGRCALTGWPIVFSTRNNPVERTASLDRIDNRRGYERDNIQWVHKDLNWMKGRFPCRDSYRCAGLLLDIPGEACATPQPNDAFENRTGGCFLRGNRVPQVPSGPGYQG